MVDIEQERIAVNADLHSDLEQYLLDNGSDQHSLYGINILFDDWEIEYDSLINPPRNRDAGFPEPDVKSRIRQLGRRLRRL